MCTIVCTCTVFQKERVEVGDVIYIEANSGAVKRLGRSDAFATEFDLEAEELVFFISRINFVANGISSMSDWTDFPKLFFASLPC